MVGKEITMRINTLIKLVRVRYGRLWK